MNIRFNQEDHEAQAFDSDKNKIAYCQYEEKADTTWAITHTVVDKNHQGEGLAEKLLDEVCNNARKKNVKIIPICSYAEKKFDSQAEKYGDLDAR
ncbi:MAG: GNAT family N-acetyltransferase [Anaerococcus sp.]|uniref:GNAT family N-acetyltransferase n=1 Tax=Anaerococcus sp. TaxID=1872515 RepID=UPI00290479B2|nr:GNAT family N-acetyltransferase [Anaerococcus sp.]MDU2565670.1 GNAT family N-acetyltransferase [Anaerococcus sp.]